MPSFLNIKRQPYEEPYHVNLMMYAGNPSTQAEFEIYANASDLDDGRWHALPEPAPSTGRAMLSPR